MNNDACRKSFSGWHEWEADLFSDRTCIWCGAKQKKPATEPVVDFFSHPLAASIWHYAKMNAARNNIDFRGMPQELLEQALAIKTPCVAKCGRVIHPIRLRAQSDRSRITGTSTAGHPFFATSCPAAIDPGCSRTKEVREEKKRLVERFR